VTKRADQGQERCGACRFYLPNKDSNPKDPTGLCRRYPPAFTGEELAQPAVSDLDWCGEFSRAAR
jgi:hypothetical protein